MTGTHYLQMEGLLLNGAEFSKNIKWEGFNDKMDANNQMPPEDAATIYMLAHLDGHQAALSASPWGPPGYLQTKVGVAPKYVVGEGKYLIKIGAKVQSDPTQMQRQDVKCEVKFRAE